MTELTFGIFEPKFPSHPTKVTQLIDRNQTKFTSNCLTYKKTLFLLTITQMHPILLANRISDSIKIGIYLSDKNHLTLEICLYI